MVNEDLVIENARIGGGRTRNFSGNPGQYNDEGKRSFLVYFKSADEAKAVEAKGWNVKWMQPREEGDDPTGYLQVSVAIGEPGNEAKYPSKIILVDSGGKTKLGLDYFYSSDGRRYENVSLDWAEFSNVDLIIRPYNWQLRSGAKGTKAYLKIGYFTLAEDELSRKYEDIPDER